MDAEKENKKKKRKTELLKALFSFIIKETSVRLRL